MLSYFPYAPATIVLLCLTSGISFYALRDEYFRDRLVLIPYDVRLDHSYWRWFTSGFVHGGPVHLFLNMLTLWFFGPLLEYELGTGWFLLLYSAGLIAGSAGTHFRYRNDSSYPGTLGASGAISGIVLGVVVTNPSLGLSLPGLTLIHSSLSLPAWIVAGIFLILSLFFMIRQNDSQKMNHDAHVWGAITGFILAFALEPGSIQHLISTM